MICNPGLRTHPLHALPVSSSLDSITGSVGSSVYGFRCDEAGSEMCGTLVLEDQDVCERCHAHFPPPRAPRLLLFVLQETMG